MNTIFVLLIAFQIKHFVADYPLQGRYMLGKFKETGWILPLASHAAVHALFTFLIAAWFGVGTAILLALIDFSIHFIVDRAKVSFSKGVTPQQPKFWHLLGLDQMAHHLTHYAIILVLIL